MPVISRAALLLLFCALPATSAAAAAAVAQIQNREAQHLGTVELTQMPDGVLIRARLAFVPAGTHAMHIHERGRCEAPFTSAGGHFAPAGNDHGLADADGRHAGDLPNIHVPETGVLELELFRSGLEIDERLLDADGAAIILHREGDDYETDPAGAAGARIACGVIEKR